MLIYQGKHPLALIGRWKPELAGTFRKYLPDRPYAGKGGHILG
jgi:hypothetical protein